MSRVLDQAHYSPLLNMLRLRPKHRGTRDGINNLLAFIPEFEAGRFNRADGYLKRTGENLPDLEALREALLSSGLISKSDHWITFHEDNYHYIEAPELIDDMRVDELQAMLTWITRMDRLSGSILAVACQSGILFSLLKRLQQLRNEGVI